jgi:hypothetical protein
VTTHRIRFLHAIMAAVVSISLSCGFMVWYVTEQNKKMCDVLAISAQDRPKPPAYPVYSDAQPSTEYGKLLKDYNLKLDTYQKQVEHFNQVALAKTRKLSKDFHCPGGNKK